MSEEHYSGFCSRLEFNRKNLPDSFEQDRKFPTTSISDKPDKKCELSYFTVNLKPVYRVLAAEGKEVSSRAKHDQNSRNSDRLKDCDLKNTATDTTSCESFYSCQSSSSLQELKSKDKFDANKKVTSVPSRFECEQNKFYREEDLSNQLTMVNAIFLRNSFSESVDNRTFKNVPKINESCHCRKRNGEKDSPSFSNTFNSEGSVNEVDHSHLYSPRIYYENSKEPHFKNQSSFTKTEEDLFHNREKNKIINLALQPLFTGENYSLKNHLSSKEESEDRTESEEKIPTKIVFQKKKYINLKPTIEKNIEVKLPSVIFPKKCSTFDDIKPQDCLVDKQISKNDPLVNVSDEEIPIMQNDMKNRSVLGLPSDEDCNGKPAICGDGNMRYKEEMMSVSLTKINEPFMNYMNESFLKKLISESLSKIKNESKNEAVSFQNKSKSSQTQLPCEPSDELETHQVETRTRSEIDISISAKQRMVKNTPFDNRPNSIPPTTNNSENDISWIIKEKSNTTSSFTKLKDENNREVDHQVVTETQRRSVRRNLSWRQNVLPVIEEESLETLQSDSSEDTDLDDYCLVDSRGRPIHLFDFEGLPLTDHRGRPLRTAQGDLLMKCDKTGIPIVDGDEGSIFDMFGRQPHDDFFDPAMAPKTVCNKLSTSNGKPLMLFDVEGQPLTSVSGTTLVDSSGRSLLRFTRNLDDSV